MEEELRADLAGGTAPDKSAKPRRDFRCYAGALVTAEALLAAVLLVWAQLWPHSAISVVLDVPKAQGGQWEVILPSGEFGLFWTYTAVALALVALTFTLLRLTTRDDALQIPVYGLSFEDIAIGCLAASLEMGLLNVGQSALSALKRVADYATSADGIVAVATSYGNSMIEPLPAWYLLAALAVVFIITVTALITVHFAKQRTGSTRVIASVDVNLVGVTVMTVCSFHVALAHLGDAGFATAATYTLSFGILCLIFADMFARRFLEHRQ